MFKNEFIIICLFLLTLSYIVNADIVANPAVSTVKNDQVTITFPTIGGGSTKSIELNISNTNKITEFSLTASIDFDNNFIVIIKEITLSLNITAPSNNTYKYIEMSKSGIASKAIGSISIKFVVEKSWIDSNNINKTSIRLNRYTTQWDALDTNLIDEDDTYAYYQSTTPDLSTFAITGENIVIMPPENEKTQSQQLQIPEIPILWIGVATVIIVLAVFFLLRRRTTA